jgi:hypothetical protein
MNKDAKKSVELKNKLIEVLHDEEPPHCVGALIFCLAEIIFLTCENEMVEPAIVLSDRQLRTAIKMITEAQRDLQKRSMN